MKKLNFSDLKRFSHLEDLNAFNDPSLINSLNELGIDHDADITNLLGLSETPWMLNNLEF